MTPQFTTQDEVRFFGRSAAENGSPLYAHLGAAAAEDSDLLTLMSVRKPGQPPANMLFAAVHHLLLGGADHPLRDYYATVGGTAALDDRAFAQFRAFCLENYSAIQALVQARVTNTNEVMRCAILAPGFCRVAEQARAPLALIELGPSAGLNLNFDRYAYRYNADVGVSSLHWGPSGLTFDCALRGPPPPLSNEPPPVIWRRGVDLNPVDLTHAEDRLWLKALIWPDRVDRMRRLDAALDIARQAPPIIEIGDAADRLAGVMAAAPTQAALCIFHSAFLYQVPEVTRVRLDAICREASFSRPVWRLSYDWAGVEGQTPLVLRHWRRGDVSETHLADSNDHGQWIRWIA